MYALVESGTITKYFNNPKGFMLGDVQYSSDIFMKWSVEEKTAIGIHEVIFDDSNKKDEEWYINTNQSFAFANDTVTASYETATPRAHADSLWTQKDSDDDLIRRSNKEPTLMSDDQSVGDIKARGLKYNLIKTLKSQVANELARTDWYLTIKTEKSTSIPSAISTHRDAVDRKSVV